MGGNGSSAMGGIGGTGDGSDSPLTPEQMDNFAKNTQFSPQDIQHLLLVYRKIGKKSGDGDLKISEDEFIREIKFGNEKIAKLIYSMIDANNDSMDFEEFVFGLNTFCPNADLDRKIELCFNVYDEDNGGSVSNDEIKAIINISLENNTFLSLDEPHLSQLVDDLFAKYVSPNSKDMTLSDFSKMVHNAPGILDSFEFEIGMLPTPDELKGV